MDSTGFKILDHYATRYSGGPFEYIDLNDFMNRRMRPGNSPIACLVEYDLVLSHTNLHPEHILLSLNGYKLVAILDWKFAGYYPPFYEFYSSMLSWWSLPSGQGIDRWLGAMSSPLTHQVDQLEFGFLTQWLSEDLDGDPDPKTADNELDHLSFGSSVGSDVGSANSERSDHPHNASHSNNSDTSNSAASSEGRNTSPGSYAIATGICDDLSVLLGFDVVRYIYKKDKCHRKVSMQVRRNKKLEFVKVILSGHYAEQEAEIVKSLTGKIPVPEIVEYGTFGPHSYVITALVQNAISMNDYVGEISDAIWEQLRGYFELIHSHQMEDTSRLDLHDWYLTAFTGDSITYTDYDSFMNKRLVYAPCYVDGLYQRKLVLTHCNIFPWNMMISHDGSQVLAIMDWEYAGYYPDNYEFEHYYKSSTGDYLQEQADCFEQGATRHDINDDCYSDHDTGDLEEYIEQSLEEHNRRRGKPKLYSMFIEPA